MLQGSELFGSTKRKLDLPPRHEYDSHHPDKVNYSIPHPNNKRMLACIEESFKHDESVGSHTTNILELECPKYQWHISELPYSSKKECQALPAKVGKSKHGTLRQLIEV